MAQSAAHPTLARTYGERAADPDLTPLATYLLQLMHFKRTNLCVSADVTTSKELIRLAEEVGDHICVLKTHADIVGDFGARTVRELTRLSQEKKFLIFEDRKFGDIGNTVQQQYLGGPLTIVRWAAIVNCHLFPGPAIITALSQAASKAITAYNTSVQTEISASPRLSAVDSPHNAEESEEEEEEEPRRHSTGRQGQDNDSEIEDLDENYPMRKHSVVSVSTTISVQSESISPQPSFSRNRDSGSLDATALDPSSSSLPHDLSNLSLAIGPPPFHRSLLLLAQMSSANNYFTPEYTHACQRHARENRGFVMGYIAQRSLNTEPGDNFITMTPGVQLAAGGDALGQQYNTPHAVIRDAGSDVIIVGRGIYGVADRAAAAKAYRKQGWLAYEERVRQARRKGSGGQ